VENSFLPHQNTGSDLSQVCYLAAFSKACQGCSASHISTLWLIEGRSSALLSMGLDGLGQPQAPCFLRGATEVLPTWILRGSTERMSQRQPRSSRSCQSLTFFALPTPDSYHFLLLFLEFTPTTESKNHPQA
jgi:hypothetical protein